MTGGMGNQMFTYALYRSLRQKGKEVCIEDFTHYDTPEKNCLQTVFHLDYRKADREVYQRLTDSEPDFLHKVKRKLTGRKEKIYQEKDAIIFEPEVFQTDDVYMIGYFQSGRYFEKAVFDLRKDFTFRLEYVSGKGEEAPGADAGGIFRESAYPQRRLHERQVRKYIWNTSVRMLTMKQHAGT